MVDYTAEERMNELEIFLNTEIKNINVKHRRKKTQKRLQSQ
jgi:hypothetical protein